MITVEEIKEYLKVEHNEEDVMISGMIEAASSMVKTKINRPIAEEEMTDGLELRVEEVALIYNHVFCALLPACRRTRI